MDWARLLAHITGTVDQELLLHNEYLVAETRNLKAKIKTRLQLPDAGLATLAEIGHRLGRGGWNMRRWEARFPLESFSPQPVLASRD